MYGPLVFSTHAGYFHTIPRLIAYFTYLFFRCALSLCDYAYLHWTICIAVSRFAGEEFSDLIASPGTRLLLTLSLMPCPRTL